MQTLNFRTQYHQELKPLNEIRYLLVPLLGVRLGRLEEFRLAHRLPHQSSDYWPDLILLGQQEVLRKQV